MDTAKLKQQFSLLTGDATQLNTVDKVGGAINWVLSDHHKLRESPRHEKEMAGIQSVGIFSMRNGGLMEYESAYHGK